MAAGNAHSRRCHSRGLVVPENTARFVFPFANVLLPTDPQEHSDATYIVVVKVDKRRGRPDCTIDHDSSTLTCQVRVAVNKPVNQDAR